ncbi:MAG: N-Acetyl-D-glucosamine ABC transport system, permease protein 1, partial [uncultured Solirubrobacteraceae bacterium]
DPPPRRAPPPGALPPGRGAPRRAPRGADLRALADRVRPADEPPLLRPRQLRGAARGPDPAHRAAELAAVPRHRGAAAAPRRRRDGAPAARARAGSRRPAHRGLPADGRPRRRVRAALPLPAQPGLRAGQRPARRTGAARAGVAVDPRGRHGGSGHRGDVHGGGGVRGRAGHAAGAARGALRPREARGLAPQPHAPAGDAAAHAPDAGPARLPRYRLRPPGLLRPGPDRHGHRTGSRDPLPAPVHLRRGLRGAPLRIRRDGHADALRADRADRGGAGARAALRPLRTGPL